MTLMQAACVHLLP